VAKAARRAFREENLKIKVVHAKQEKGVEEHRNGNRR